jgi:CRP-like cAMP-binding protein
MAVDAALLSTLYPLEKLAPDRREALAQDARLLELTRDTVIFREGDLDSTTYWLLQGEVDGRYENGREKRISAASLQGRYAIGDLQPRRFSAVVVSPTAQLLACDRRFTEKLIALDELIRGGKVPLWLRQGGPAPWLMRMLKNRAFNRLPSTHLERLISALEELRVAAGTAVVREGEDGDAFYVIREGVATVSKEEDGRELPLAQLRAGDSFGEDALLTGAPRNATVSMRDAGLLMRLPKASFDKLLRSAAAEWVTSDKALAMLKQGAVLLDVRSQEEFAKGSIPGARNLPAEFLRANLDRLPRDRRYLVFCNGADRSGSAVFQLSKHGLDAHAVFGGYAALLTASKR